MLQLGTERLTRHIAEQVLEPTVGTPFPEALVAALDGELPQLPADVSADLAARITDEDPLSSAVYEAARPSLAKWVIAQSGDVAEELALAVLANETSFSADESVRQAARDRCSASAPTFSATVTSAQHLLSEEPSAESWTDGLALLEAGVSAGRSRGLPSAVFVLNLTTRPRCGSLARIFVRPQLGRRTRMASRKFLAPVRAPTIIAALALAAGMLVVLAPTAVAGPAPCQTKNVRTGVEYKGASSLTIAITDAATGDTIKIYGTCYGNHTLSKDLTLQGQGKNATLDGSRTGTVLHITNGTTTIDGLKITNGVANVESVEGNGCCVGGGIAVSGDTAGARLVNSLVTANAASVFGGGIDVDDGTLTLVNSTVTGNTSDSSGGIDSDFGTITLIGSTVSNNTVAGGTACQGVGSCAGGIWNFGGTLTLIDSTVSGNTATRRGGGIVNQTPTGGPTAVLTLSGTSAITNNHAISDPTVNLGGGIWIRGDATVSATADWTGSVSGNTPDQCSPTVTIGSTTCGA